MEITDDKMIQKLILAAQKARGRAYAPYSHYLVGAALLCADQSIVQGCNIENASYGATNCAERTALFGAIAQGKKDFTAMALVSGPEDEKMYPRGASYKGYPEDIPYPSPCGICRQALREFVTPENFPIILAKTTGDYRICTLHELLPESFGPEYL